MRVSKDGKVGGGTAANYLQSCVSCSFLQLFALLLADASFNTIEVDTVRFTYFSDVRKIYGSALPVVVCLS